MEVLSNAQLMALACPPVFYIICLEWVKGSLLGAPPGPPPQLCGSPGTHNPGTGHPGMGFTHNGLLGLFFSS